MPEDLYADFATRYDLFFGEFGKYSKPESLFYRSLFERFNVKSVLDCACGTGRHLPLFLALGCQLTASDYSESMLEQAAKNLTAAGLNVPLARVDYRRLPDHYTHHFDAVVCLSSAIDEMPDEENVVTAFRSMRAVLKPGGILVLNQGTSDSQWNSQTRFIPAVNTPDFSRVFVIDYLAKGARYNILDLFHSPAHNEFRTWTMQYNLVLLKDDMERLLERAGFTGTEFWGDYDEPGYDKTTSRRLIAIAIA